jgi:hypothetical protein
MLKIEETIQEWKYEHFMLFIYIYVAMSDNELVNSEWDLIKDKLSPTFNSDEYRQNFITVANCFEKCKDVDIFNVIDYFKTKFELTDKDKAKILADIRDIAKADDNFRAQELQIETGIRRLLS